MRNWLWTVAGTVALVGLCACGPVNPVIGTGESSVMVTNDLGVAITSLEVLAGAPEGFETILPTEDVETIEPGQTAQVMYEVGEATYDPGTIGSGQTDQTSDEPMAEPTSEVGEAPNAVYLDENGVRTSENEENALNGEATPDADAQSSESGEEALVDEATGATADSSTSGSDANATSDDFDAMPIQGDAIRVVANGETLVFDGLDLPSYKEVSLRTNDQGVNYVDYIDQNGKTGSTKEAATMALEQWEAAKKSAEDAQKPADAATDAEDTTAENGTDPNAGYDEGYTNTADQGDEESTAAANDQSDEGSATGEEQGDEGVYDENGDDYAGGSDSETGEGVGDENG